ncbi:MAG: hypothetical protein AAGA17_00255 [Actinomycetota bacterium]
MARYVLRGGPVQLDGEVVEGPGGAQEMVWPNYESGPQRSCVLRYRSQMGTLETLDDGRQAMVLRFDDG